MGQYHQDNYYTSVSHTETYGYDAVNRLATAEADTLNTPPSCLWGLSMPASTGYDRWGNLLTRTVTCGTAAPLSLSVNSSTNQITSTGYGYDAAGNVTSNPAVSPTQTYQWDAEGRVASVNSGSLWTFTYNALGHRVEWNFGGYVLDEFFDPAGNLLGMPGQWFKYTFLGHAIVVAGGAWFSHPNHLGSDVMTTNYAGAVAGDVTFYPWGNLWQQQGGMGYNFASIPYYDTNTNTSITTNRFYPNNIGHWLSPDLLGGDISNPQSLNRYAYVLNNPTSLTDPTGLNTEACQWSGGALPGCENTHSGGGGGGGGDGGGWTDPGMCIDSPVPDPTCGFPPGWWDWGGGRAGGAMPGNADYPNGSEVCGYIIYDLPDCERTNFPDSGTITGNGGSWWLNLRPLLGYIPGVLPPGASGQMNAAAQGTRVVRPTPPPVPQEVPGEVPEIQLEDPVWKAIFKAMSEFLHGGGNGLFPSSTIMLPMVNPCLFPDFQYMQMCGGGMGGGWM